MAAMERVIQRIKINVCAAYILSLAYSNIEGTAKIIYPVRIRSMESEVAAVLKKDRVKCVAEIIIPAAAKPITCQWAFVPFR